MKFESELAEYAVRKQKAMAMGGPEKLAQRKAEGILNARERIDLILDPGSFRESGLFGTAVDPAMRHKAPADGKVAGFGRIDGREVGIISNDFTVLGASSAKINGQKIDHVKRASIKSGVPLIFLGESTGARMPDIMGAAGIGGGSNPTKFLRLRENPWASAVLGNAFGSSAWFACMADFNVMRRGAVLAVSSPRLTSMATGEEVDPEELGGWKLHDEVTGLADAVADTDEAALDAIKRFLSYMPSNHMELPPRAPTPPGSDEDANRIMDILPESRRSVYDVNKVLTAVADRGSLFELKPHFGRSMVTALARIDGQSVGFIANNPLFRGGAIDANACSKVTNFLVLCDSFNLPIIFFVDQPGFFIGAAAERQGMPGKVTNWMNALQLCTVPKFSIIMRKSYGQAVLNMGCDGNADEVAAWVTAEVGFMDPASAVRIVHGIKEADDPERFQAALKTMARGTSAYELAAVYGAHEVILPSETRDYLKRMLQVYRVRPEQCQHLMRTWPTSVI